MTAAEDAPARWLPDDLQDAELTHDDPLDVTRLDGCLRAALPALRGPMTVRRFTTTGPSRTYRVQVGATRLVVHLPPLGSSRLTGGTDSSGGSGGAETSAGLLREFRVLESLSPRYPRAPRPLHVCTDPDVLGDPFLVTQFRPGFVVRDRLPNAMVLLPDVGERIARAVVAALVEMHGLRDEGGDGERPVTHGAFALSQCLFDEEQPDIVTGVVGWGRGLLGTPLEDLDHLVRTWPDGPDGPCGAFGGLPPRSRLPGIYEEHARNLPTR